MPMELGELYHCVIHLPQSCPMQILPEAARSDLLVTYPVWYTICPFDPSWSASTVGLQEFTVTSVTCFQISPCENCQQ